MKAAGSFKGRAAQDNLTAIGWALLATGLFALVAALAKIAVTDYHVLQILFFRQLFVFATTLPAIARSPATILKTNNPGLHGWRLAGAFTALSASIWAVAVLPLTTAITLAFTQVFFVTMLAALFLGEGAGPHRLAAIAVGFGGVLLIMRPGSEAFTSLHALIPIIGALGAAIAVISVRKLSQSESTATLLAYQAVFIGLLAGIPLFWLWETPDWPGLVLLASMGILSSVGQWVGIKALRHGEASIVGSIEYVKLIYALLLGYVLFGEIPDLGTLSGAVIIVMTALYVFHREQRKKKS